MKMILVQNECWEVIEKEKPKKEEDIKIWEKADTKARYYLTLCVENNQLTYFKNKETAKEVWNALKSVHQRSSMCSKTRLLKKLFKSELKKGDNDMEKHLQTLQDWMDELSELGYSIDEKYKKAIILASLNEDYDMLVTALEAREEDKLSIDDIKAKLLDESDRRKQKCERESSTALKITKGNHGTNKKKFQGIKCFNCNEFGHISKYCDKKNSKHETNKKNSHKIGLVMSGNHFSLLANGNDINGWCIDSGATCHVCNSEAMFTSLNLGVQDVITVANGEKLKAVGKGNVDLVIKTNSGALFNATIYDVLYVPEAKGCLLSVQRLIERDYQVIFKGDIAILVKGRRRYAIGKLVQGLYILNEYKQEKINYVKKDKFCIHQWHRKLAHRNLEDVKRMLAADKLEIMECNCKNDCESCIKGKMVRESFPKKSLNPAKKKLDVIVTDVCGPMQTNSIGGNRYFVTFIDEYSRYSHVFLIREKSEVADILIQFIEMIKTKFGARPKVIRSDRGGEYMNAKVQKYLETQGIKVQYTVAYSPQQNGIAERKNRTLMDAVRSMLYEANLDYSYWAEAVMCANYVQNRLVTSSTGKTPFEVFEGDKPIISGLHEFGADCYAWIPKEKRKKLDEKARKLKFMGYDESSKGYRLVDADSKSIIIARDVKFLQSSETCQKQELTREDEQVIIELESNKSVQETIQDMELNDIPEVEVEELQCDTNRSVVSESSYYESEVSFYETDHDDEHDEDYIDETIQVNDTNPVRRSNRGNLGSTTKYDDYVCKAVNLFENEPITYEEAIRCKDSKCWLKAMNEEMKSIHKNETWSLVDLPKDRKAIGSKWVFKVKRDVNGNVSRYKARLVAQGYSQKYGTDYDEVFAPVVRQTTFRVLLSVAAKREYKVQHYDIKTAFLNGNLEEEIYMKQPPGFIKGNKVCKLNKGLYGLKQAARSWNKAIHNVLMSNDYKQSKFDKCLYMKMNGVDACYILIYVDDIIIASNNMKMIDTIANKIGSKFEMTNLGSIKQFLGMEVEKDNDGNFLLSQKNYIDKIVEDCGLSDGKASKYPLDTGYDKLACDELLSNSKIYQKIIGQLLYLSTNTRPDISASVSILSQRMCKPRKIDLNEVKRVVRYLKGTRNYKLKLSSSNCEHGIVAYTDANWAESRVDRKSNSGYIFMLNGGTVSWCCRKQECVSLSSTEAEYIALSEGCQELTWLKGICNDMNVDIKKSTKVFVDNQSCIKLVDNQKFSNRSKHIDTKYHYIRDLSDKGELTLEYCTSEDNVADLMTKPLGPKRIDYLRLKANIIN